MEPVFSSPVPEEMSDRPSQHWKGRDKESLRKLASWTSPVGKLWDQLRDLALLNKESRNHY